MWQLITEDNLKYFQLQYGNYLLIYSTKYSEEKFLKKFNPVFLKQIHSDIIVDIDRPAEMIGDGLMTRTDRPIGIKVADCLPVYLFDGEKICILHCGWRSLFRGILKNVLQIFKDYKYALGSAIGPCCYEIKDDVADIFNKKFSGSLIYKDKKIFLDLKKAVIKILGNENLIGNLDYCTKCHPEYFYSYRGGDVNKRNYAVILQLHPGNLFVKGIESIRKFN
ncbi:MAG: polyphenol oxidase family protein [candidate division WOR-3 bacterium]